MIIRESITFLVLEKDTRQMVRGEGIMVAVASQLATVQDLEMVLFIVDLLKQGKTAHLTKSANIFSESKLMVST